MVTTKQANLVQSVRCNYSNRRVYLQVCPQGGRVKVMPTADGRRLLDRFWPVWLRDSILRNAPGKDTYSVEIQGKFILVSSSASYDAMNALVYGLSQEIRPLKSVLIYNVWAESYFGMKWYFKKWAHDRYVPLAFIGEAVRLPSGASLYIGEENFPRYRDKNGETLSLVADLYRESSCKHSLSDLRKLVEYQLSLACS